MSPTQIRLYEAGILIAVHPLLEGRYQRSVLRGHRSAQREAVRQSARGEVIALTRAGQRVACRSLTVYEAIGQGLARSAPRQGEGR